MDIETQRHADMETYTVGGWDIQMETWKHRDIHMYCRYGNIEKWRHVDWRYRDIETWRHGDMETLRHVHGDMDMEAWRHGDTKTWTWRHQMQKRKLKPR
jgi:hypothetical protein